MTDYADWFRAATGNRPYGWQAALASSATCGDRLVRIPTGFGKTFGVLGAWLYHRVVRGDERWPRRLIWTLPMRVLVEQTEAEVRQVLEAVGLLWNETQPHEGKVGVHALMGGSEAGDWHLFPEEAAVLVGTQDMTLSRALNRGYGAARGRWPTDFGLVSQDALWVLDEVQLMDVGLTTAAQLAAFRLGDADKAFRPSYTWAMSATLQRDWLTKSPDTGPWVGGLREVTLGAADEAATLWKDTTKPIRRDEAMPVKRLVETILATHTASPGSETLTLVVMNTVGRARELYEALRKSIPAGGPQLHLLHSRFRGVERAAWRADLLGKDAPKASRIVVATQVIEAGVDLSANALFTELCPWPSLVQRLGRLARRGGTGDAVVLGLDTAKASAPYEAAELDAAWDALASVSDGSPRALKAFEERNPDLVPGLYPYDPPHILLREELDELFDTTPDLTGADIDVSRFIRSGDERDVSVFWVAEAPGKRTRAVREGLCAVPFLQARDWLCGKKSGQVEPKNLRPGVNAWVWDYLDGRWRTAQRKDLWPGQTVLVDAAVGGYDPELGWRPESRTAVPLVDAGVAGAQELADSAQSQEDLSEAAWQTVGFHGAAVATRTRRYAGMMPSSVARVLHLASRWHDLGKAHPAFQGAIVGVGRPDRADLAKAPKYAWRDWRTGMYQVSAYEVRYGFRHELASALALFAVLERHAPPDHPSRLGELSVLFPNVVRAQSPPPGPLEAEVLSLSSEEFDLTAFLVCSHHGKVRARLHSAPADQRAALSGGDMPIRGVREGDVLPGVAMPDAEGRSHFLPSVRLTLEPASLGLSPSTGRSWAERVEGLLSRHGPFGLAWLEALLRAADVGASRDVTLKDPALTAKETV